MHNPLDTPGMVFVKEIDAAIRTAFSHSEGDLVVNLNHQMRDRLAEVIDKKLSRLEKSRDMELINLLTKMKNDIPKNAASKQGIVSREIEGKYPRAKNADRCAVIHKLMKKFVIGDLLPPYEDYLLTLGRNQLLPPYAFDT